MVRNIVASARDRVITSAQPKLFNLLSTQHFHAFTHSKIFNNGAWRTGNYQAIILFENKDLQAKGETTVIQNRAHPSQQKFFEFLCTRKLCSLFHILLTRPMEYRLCMFSWNSRCVRFVMSYCHSKSSPSTECSTHS